MRAPSPVLWLIAALASAGCSPSSGSSGRPAPSGSALPTNATAPSSTRPAGDARTVEIDGLEKLAHKPVVVLVEKNPWLMVVGSDVPTVTLYEDGLAVYHRGERQEIQALTVRAPDEVKRLVAAIVGGGFMSLPPRSSSSASTDQPTVSIVVRSGTRWKYADVYGIDRQGKPSTGQGDPAPAAFLDAYARLRAFDPPGATAWVPEKVEVMLWDFSHSKRPGRPWPSGVPAPPPGVRAPTEGVYKHFLEGRFEAPVRDFTRSLAPGEGVALNGQTWSIGSRRIVPEEDYIEAVRTCAWRTVVVKPPASTPPSCH